MKNPRISATSINRRILIRTAGAAALAGPWVWSHRAWGQEKTIQIGSGSGPQTDFMREHVVPPFQREFGCRVLLNEGASLAQVTKMRAEKASPRHTVMFVDEIAIDQCRQEDLVSPLPADKMPNLAKVPARLIYEDGHGVAILASVGGMFYNTSMMAAPRSFADMWGPDLRKKVTLSSIRITSGMFVVVAAAAVATGKPLNEAQYLAEAGFKQLEKMVPNVLNVHTASAQGASTVAQGEAALGAMSYSRFVLPYREKGAPIQMAYPQEGTFPGINCQVLVKNGPFPELGAAFLNRMLDPAVQTAFAELTGGAPAVQGLQLSAELKNRVLYDENQLRELKVMTPDYRFLNKSRNEWTANWNRILTA